MASNGEAILVVAHGSRRAEANADLRVVASELQIRQPDCIIEVAYLELAAPSIPEGLQKCVERQASSIRILPYFLSAGSHVTDDLRGFRDTFRTEHPSIRCELCPPIGLHPLMIDILTARSGEEI